MVGSNSLPASQRKSSVLCVDAAHVQPVTLSREAAQPKSSLRRTCVHIQSALRPSFQWRTGGQAGIRNSARITSYPVQENPRRLMVSYPYSVRRPRNSQLVSLAFSSGFPSMDGGAAERCCGLHLPSSPGGGRTASGRDGRWRVARRIPARRRAVVSGGASVGPGWLSRYCDGVAPSYADGNQTTNGCGFQY